MSSCIVKCSELLVFGRACSFPSWANLLVSSSLSLSSFSPPLLFPSLLLSSSLSSDPKSFLYSFFLSTILLDQHLPIYLFLPHQELRRHHLWRESFVDLRLEISHLLSLLFLHCIPSFSVNSTILLQLTSLFFPKIYSLSSILFSLLPSSVIDTLCYCHHPLF